MRFSSKHYLDKIGSASIADAKKWEKASERFIFVVDWLDISAHDTRADDLVNITEDYFEDMLLEEAMYNNYSRMMDENRGYYDGIASKRFKTPAHKAWPDGPHFNADYERGYWTGWNGGSLPYKSEDFEIFDREDEANGFC